MNTQTPVEGSEVRRVFALDIGLSSTPVSMNAGEIVELSEDGGLKTLVRSQAMPDGLVIDAATQRILWTCMGVPGKKDGAVYSARLDGSNIKIVVAPGKINTPKQLTLDERNGKLYFCDREGCGIFRCDSDGTNLEQIVDKNPTGPPNGNIHDWCVGVTLAPSIGKLYWTQKGPSKAGGGRIFSAEIPLPGEQIVGPRCLLDNLPKPIDLEFDEKSLQLYWTDRGEIPFGNSLNRVQLDR